MRMLRLTSQARAAIMPLALLERGRARVVTTSAELGVRVIEPIERWIGCRSLVGDTPFYDTAGFAWNIAHSPLVRDARRRQARWTAELAARPAAAPA
jgi:hypothetical protein